MAAAQPAKAKASAPVAERAGAGVGGQAVAVAQVAGRRWRAAGVCSLINYVSALLAQAALREPSGSEEVIGLLRKAVLSVKQLSEAIARQRG